MNIPYGVSRNGTKVVTLYVDGKQQNAHTPTPAKMIASVMAVKTRKQSSEDTPLEMKDEK